MKNINQAVQICEWKKLSMKKGSTTFARPNERLEYCRDVCKGTILDVDSEGNSVVGRCYAPPQQEDRPRKAYEINLEDSFR